VRKAKVERKTTEVQITIELNIDGTGKAKVETGIKFLNHLLVTFAKHSFFDLTIRALGDVKHHVSEDVALTLGEALAQALGNKKGIARFGSAYVPMDDSLARAVVDLGGRAYANLDLKVDVSQIEDLKIEDLTHFFYSFAQTAKANIHLAVLYGRNEHHKIEAVTKALALALRQAVGPESRIKDEVLSAKGVL
jgi:imidazoleglycerol-phosphate dehydratase